MEVLKLMNSNPNWRDVLGADPYNITIKEDGEFVLLKYSQIDSDFNLPIVRECRGAIFVKEEDGWRCVRRAFDKFGNYGEGYATDIDWVEDNHYFSLSRAEFANAIKNLKYKHFIFGVYDNKLANVKDHLKSLRIEQVLNLIESL